MIQIPLFALEPFGGLWADSLFIAVASPESFCKSVTNLQLLHDVSNVGVC